MIFVPPRFAADSILEAADAGIDDDHRDHRGHPRPRRAARLQRTSRARPALRLIGPNCPGVLSPGKANVGIIPASFFKEGNVGVVSRSGTLTYQIGNELAQRGFGNSSIVGIGGDPIPGTTFIDVIGLFQEDPETELIVLSGEIGGDAEERAAEFIEANVTKPVVAYIAGFSAPPGKTMGHAGAIISGSQGTAAAKAEALEAKGVKVGRTPTEVARLAVEILGLGRGLAASALVPHVPAAGPSRLAPSMPPCRPTSSPSRAARRPRTSSTSTGSARLQGRPSRTTRRARPRTAPPSATCRCARGSPRSTASTRRRSSSRTGRCRPTRSSSTRSSSPGDAVVVERPTYDRTLLGLRQRGAECVPVELEPDGIDVDALAKLLEGGLRPKLAHIIPNFQNPAGYTLSREKRDRLLELAREYDFLDLRGRPVRRAALRGERRCPRCSRSTSPTTWSTRRRSPRPCAPASASATSWARRTSSRKIVYLATNTYISPNMVAQSIVQPVRPRRARSRARSRR